MYEMQEIWSFTLVFYTCVRCSGNCSKVCNNEIRKCANCNGDHSAVYKGCPIYKSEIKRAEQKLFMQSYKIRIIETENRTLWMKTRDKTYKQQLNKIQKEIKTDIINAKKDQWEDMYNNINTSEQKSWRSIKKILSSKPQQTYPIYLITVNITPTTSITMKRWDYAASRRP